MILTIQYTRIKTKRLRLNPRAESLKTPGTRKFFNQLIH